MILVDTSVWIDYFSGVENNKTNLLDRSLSEQSVLIGDIILTEILQGFDRDRDFKRAAASGYRKRYLHKFCYFL